MDGAGLRPLAVFVFVALTGVFAVSPPVAATGTVAAEAAAPAAASVPLSGQATMPPVEWLAWKMGTEYSYAWAWSLMKEDGQSEKSLGFARTFAKALGLAEPPPPTGDYRKLVLALAKEVDSKHGEKTRYHFLAGVRVTDAWFGAVIKSDVKTQLDDVGEFLAKSGIPDSVWSPQLTTIKAKTTDADLSKLAKAIDQHLRR
jgi:hypothetical protein